MCRNGARTLEQQLDREAGTGSGVCDSQHAKGRAQMCKITRDSLPVRHMRPVSDWFPTVVFSVVVGRPAQALQALAAPQQPPAVLRVAIKKGVGAGGGQFEDRLVKYQFTCVT